MTGLLTECSRVLLHVRSKRRSLSCMFRGLALLACVAHAQSQDAEDLPH
jgi:hypothetical protein